MSFSDLRIAAIAIILFLTYGTFLYLNASAEQTELSASVTNVSEFNTPDSVSFFDVLTEIGHMNTQYPEIFFLNTMLFGTIGFLLVFVGLRYLRGTG